MSVQGGRVEMKVAYLASTGDNQVVFTGKAFLYGITIGDATTTVEISDSATDGDGNLIMKLTTPPCGYYPINTNIQTGITLDITTAGQVSVHYV